MHVVGSLQQRARSLMTSQCIIVFSVASQSSRAEPGIKMQPHSVRLLVHDYRTEWYSERSCRIYELRTTSKNLIAL